MTYMVLLMHSLLLYLSHVFIKIEKSLALRAKLSNLIYIMQKELKKTHYTGFVKSVRSCISV